jgi:hypothetical protein
MKRIRLNKIKNTISVSLMTGLLAISISSKNTDVLAMPKDINDSNIAYNNSLNYTDNNLSDRNVREGENQKNQVVHK